MGRRDVGLEPLVHRGTSEGRPGVWRFRIRVRDHGNQMWNVDGALRLSAPLVLLVGPKVWSGLDGPVGPDTGGGSAGIHSASASILTPP